jgi:HEAT repeat protein
MGYEFLGDENTVFDLYTNSLHLRAATVVAGSRKHQQPKLLAPDLLDTGHEVRRLSLNILHAMGSE